MTVNHHQPAYESCVVDTQGNCTRWSHDHSGEPALSSEKEKP